MTPSIQNVIQTILSTVPGAPLKKTVDTFKTGDPSQEVTGIVTTFLANREVIESAKAIVANLIITHEPIFYNHRDRTGWLKGDEVYKSKRRYIDDNKIVIWRFHDHWHMHRPDGITTGFLKELGWERYAIPEKEYLCTIPPVTLRKLVATIKEKLFIQMVRVAGNPDMTCRKVGLMLGAAPGKWQINLLSQTDIDVLICGESDEWETCEYIRDAAFIGKEQALVIIGHANSEDWGMKWLVDWLRPKFPGIPISHIPTRDPFHFM